MDQVHYTGCDVGVQIHFGYCERNGHWFARWHSTPDQLTFWPDEIESREVQFRSPLALATHLRHVVQLGLQEVEQRRA